MYLHDPLLVIGAVAVAPLVAIVLPPLTNALATRAPVRRSDLWRWFRDGVHLHLCRSVVLSAVAATLAGLVALRWQSELVPALVALWTLVAALLASAVDIRCHRLPDVVVGPLWLVATSAAVAWSVAVGDPWRVLAVIVGPMVAVGVLGVAWLVGMGLGDVKFGGALSVVLALSAPSLPAAVASSLWLVGGAAVLGCAWCWGRSVVGQPIARWFPFGPFLATAWVALVLVAGPPVLDSGGTSLGIGSPCGGGPPVDSWMCFDS